MTDLIVKLFIKNYQNTSDPAVRGAYGMLASISGILVNVLLFAMKFTVGTLLGSVSIVGDAVNNLSDAGSQIISLISFRIALKPADRQHPFGHARIEYVASMIVSFLVLLIGVELLKESVTKIFNPEPPETGLAAVAVLFLSILIKLGLALFHRSIGNRIQSSVIRATATDSLSDALATTAVLITATVMLIFPDLPINLDAYMGVAVSVMILIAGIKILNETKNSILGEAPSDEIVKQIYDTVKKHPAALGVHDLTVHNYGPGHIIAALHVEVDGKVDVFETHDMIDNIERELRRNYSIEATIHMDPIVTDDKRITDLREKVLDAVHKVDPTLQIHDFRFVEGTTHTNLIFDVSVPFEIKRPDIALKHEIQTEISRINPSYFAVITLDRI